jgi:hypothetical protein
MTNDTVSRLHQQLHAAVDRSVFFIPSGARDLVGCENPEQESIFMLV